MTAQQNTPAPMQQATFDYDKISAEQMVHGGEAYVSPNAYFIPLNDGSLFALPQNPLLEGRGQSDTTMQFD